MGQAYCESECFRAKNEPSTLENAFDSGDYPSPRFAKSVKQSIEVLPKIK